MGFLIGLFAKLGLGEKLAAAAAYGLVIAALIGALLWLRADAYSDGKADMQALLDEANAAYLEQKGRADELAADRRVADIVAVSKTEGELIDAIETVPDEKPDAVRIKLGCERLRRSGKDQARFPACRGHASGGQASPAG